jgi:hypothetical protein
MSAIDTVLRVKIAEGTTTQQVDHFMVDSLYAVHSVDDSIAHATELIDPLGKG